MLETVEFRRVEVIWTGAVAASHEEFTHSKHSRNRFIVIPESIHAN